MAATTDDTPVAIIGESMCPKAIEFKTTDNPQSRQVEVGRSFSLQQIVIMVEAKHPKPATLNP